MYEHILQKIGLSPSEIAVYEALLRFGETAPPALQAPTGLSRTNLYNVLASLKSKGLVSETGGTKTLFRPSSPEILRTIAKQKDEEVHIVSKEIDALIPTLNSQYNLTTGKPVVRYYEGLTGVEDALNDSLTTRDIIRTFIDDSATTTIGNDINMRYVAKRKKLGVKKRIIATNVKDAVALKASQDAVTEIRILVGNSITKTAVEIYDKRVSFLTIHEKQIGIILEDEFIANAHRILFDALWNILPPL